MKIVAIIGSPRGMNGNTGSLLGPLLESAKDAGAEVVLFSLAELTVDFCKACDACHRTGACAVKDDFEPMKQEMSGADGVVLASPNYIFSVTAQLKALMDRCCGPMHCNMLNGKYGAAIVTSGGYESRGVEEYLLRFLRAMGCWTVGSLGAALPQLIDEEQREPLLQRTAQLGGEMVTAIREAKSYPEQERERAAFMERMRGLVYMNRERWPFEYQYWMGREGKQAE